jgi:hypothetical protein
VELFEAIRRDHRRDGLSIRELSQKHRVHRRTVRAALASAVPPPRKARVFAAYFARHEHADGDRWSSGRIAAQQWADVLNRESVTAEELAQLDELIHQGANETGSGWLELRIIYSPKLRRV